MRNQMNNLKNELTWLNAVIVLLVIAGMSGWACLMYVVMQSR